MPLGEKKTKKDKKCQKRESEKKNGQREEHAKKDAPRPPKTRETKKVFWLGMSCISMLARFWRVASFTIRCRNAIELACESIHALPCCGEKKKKRQTSILVRGRQEQKTRLFFFSRHQTDMYCILYRVSAMPLTWCTCVDDRRLRGPSARAHGEGRVQRDESAWRSFWPRRLHPCSSGFRLVLHVYVVLVYVRDALITVLITIELNATHGRPPCDIGAGWLGAWSS